MTEKTNKNPKEDKKDEELQVITEDAFPTEFGIQQPVVKR